MTIGKSTVWGSPGALPPNAPRLGSDRALRHLVEDCRRNDRPIPVVGLTGGSLWRTMGGPGSGRRIDGPEAWQYPTDIAAVDLDGSPFWFVASLVARRRWWTTAFVVMNAQWVGRYQFGHRAHPGDGLLDAYRASLGFSDVGKVARRARSGAHLPHPGISERRAARHEFSTTRPVTVWLDGEKIGQFRHIAVRVEPDACTVVL